MFFNLGVLRSLTSLNLMSRPRCLDSHELLYCRGGLWFGVWSLGILPPNTGESHGNDNAKEKGNCDYVVVIMGLLRPSPKPLYCPFPELWRSRWFSFNFVTKDMLQAPIALDVPTITPF